MALRPVATLAVIAAACITSSCATQSSYESPQSASTSAVADAGAPTFYADVLPVLQENCQVCHIAQGLDLGGMIAPMAFVTYDEIIYK